MSRAPDGPDRLGARAATGVGASGAGPRRVLMTADAVGGVWTYALDLAAGLARGGTEVTLAVMGGAPSADQARGAARLPGVDLRVADYRLEWMADPWPDVDAGGDWLLALHQETGADLVHLNGFAHGALPFGVPVLVVVHSCVASWWRAVHGAPAPDRWDEYRRRVARGAAAADLVVAPTAAVLRAFEHEHGRLARSRVVPNGRDPTPFAPAPEEPFVLAAGRVRDPAKGLDTLARASHGLPWPVYVAGDALPDDGAVGSGALWSLGRLPAADLAAWMARAAVFAHPARYEPFGLAPLEAALSGCALVLGDVPSLREVWGDAAAYVDPDDAGALHAALANLAGDDARRRRLAARARRRARRFGAHRMVDAYRAVYVELLGRGSAARPAAGQGARGATEAAAHGPPADAQAAGGGA